MTATVRVYKSTDASAPVLSGQVGALIALFDACLVNGYGALPAAGWTKPYTSTNIAVFRAGAGTPRPYLRVDDTAAQEGRLTGYDSMSAHSTGTDDFPTTAQVSGGLYQRKSSTANSTARPWLLIACERAFYFFAFTDKATYGAASDGADIGMFFGVFPSRKSGDAFNSAIVASASTGSNQGRLGTINSVASTGALGSAATGAYVCRAFTQTGTSLNVVKTVPGSSSGNASVVGNNVGCSYPDPISGTMNLNHMLLCESDGSGNLDERGYYPGFWGCMHNLPAAFFDTFDGAGAMAGKTFILPPMWHASTQGRAAIETSGSWDL